MKKVKKNIFFQVDLEYPDELHELHNNFLLAPEKLAVTSDMLSKNIVRKLLMNMT